MDKSMTELRSVTCHMGSHSVTCHPTQVSAPCLNPSHAGWYSIYLPWRDGRLSWPCYSEAQLPGVELATSRTRIQRPNHWATKQQYLFRSVTEQFKWWQLLNCSSETNKYKCKQACYCHLWKRTRSLQYTPSVPSCFCHPVCPIWLSVASFVYLSAISCTSCHIVYVLSVPSFLFRPKWWLFAYFSCPIVSHHVLVRPRK